MVDDVIGDRWCGRLLAYPFNTCSLDTKKYYFDCIQALCIKSFDSWEAQICNELETLETDCLSTETASQNSLKFSTWKTEGLCEISCEGNKHIENGVCVSNKCNCGNGEPVKDADCTEHGAIQCKVDKCEDGYISTKYKAINGEFNFLEANRFCQNQEMRMAEIRSGEDNQLAALTIRQVDWGYYLRQESGTEQKIDVEKSADYYIGARRADGYPGGHANAFFWLDADGEIKSVNTNNQLRTPHLG